jgi:hypothetical protein
MEGSSARAIGQSQGGVIEAKWWRQYGEQTSQPRDSKVDCSIPIAAKGRLGTKR